MELSSSNTKEFLIFSQKKAFFYISRNKNHETELSYISGSGSSEKLKLKEVTFRARKTKKTLLLKSSLNFRNRSL